MGFFSGAGECLGPATIKDIFFLHERATAMAGYNFATGQGVNLGIIISGAITLGNSWRVIYYVGAGAIGVLLILIVFTFPETSYMRSYQGSEKLIVYEKKKTPYRLSLSIIVDDGEEKARLERYYQELEEREGVMSMSEMERSDRLEEVVDVQRGTKDGMKSYWSTLPLWTGEIYTSESLWTMCAHPSSAPP